MAKIETYHCDECGAVKAQANHWLTLTVNEAGFHLYPWSGLSHEKQHLCGAECAQKKLSKFIEEQTR